MKMLILACIACASTATPVLKHTPQTTLPSYAPREREIPDQAVGIRNTESRCPQGTVAGRLHIPTEPEDAWLVAQIMARDVSTRNLPYWPEGLVGVGMEATTDQSGPRLLCIYWDLRENDRKIDFYTCRHLTKNPTSYGYSIGRYPVGYAFDVYADANGEPAKFQHFMDRDHDGDICDSELLHLEAEKQPTP